MEEHAEKAEKRAGREEEHAERAEKRAQRLEEHAERAEKRAQREEEHAERAEKRAQRKMRSFAGGLSRGRSGSRRGGWCMTWRILTEKNG